MRAFEALGGGRLLRSMGGCCDSGLVAGCGVYGLVVETSWAISRGTVGKTEGEFSCHGWQTGEGANAFEERWRCRW